jgi:hypothetical protein
MSEILLKHCWYSPAYEIVTDRNGSQPGAVPLPIHRIRSHESGDQHLQEFKPTVSAFERPIPAILAAAIINIFYDTAHSSMLVDMGNCAHCCYYYYYYYYYVLSP